MQYRALNADKLTAYFADHHLKNREARNAAMRTYAAAHPAEARERSKRYRKNRPEVKRAGVRRRRAKKAQADGSHTAADVAAMYEKQDAKCKECAAGLSGGYHVDHIHPITRGGSNWPKNLQLLCAPCNQSKGNKTMDEWREWKAQRGGLGVWHVLAQAS